MTTLLRPELLRQLAAGNRQRRAIGVVDRRHDEQQQQDDVADACWFRSDHASAETAAINALM